jgi:hypothetical protein
MYARKVGRTKPKIDMKNLRVILVSLLVSVAGCQTGQPAKTAAIDNGSFMNLWSTYSHCQAAADIDQMKQDALILTHTANSTLSKGAFVLPLPGKLEKFISTPAARFAVDVKAMAASCTLRAGAAAVEAGRLDVARDLLQTILSYQPQSEYAYYTQQAKALLSEIRTNVVEITLNLP